MNAERVVSTTEALRRVLREAPALRKGLVLTVAMATAGTAIQVVVPVVVQQIVDLELLDPGGVDVAGATVRGIVAVAAMAVAMYVRGVALVRLAGRSAHGLSQLRIRAFEHLHSLSVLHVETERRGTLVARVTSDISAVQEFMDWGGVGLLIGSAQVVLAVVAMLLYRWQLALLVVVAVIVYAAMLVWFQRILRRQHDQVRSRVADSLAALGEAISGLVTVRAYGAEDRTVAKVERVLDAQFRSEYNTMKLGATLFSSAELFAGLITAVVVGVGIVIGPANGITAGTLLAFLFLVNLLVEPIQTLVETLDQAQSAAAGIRRVLNVLSTPVDVVDPGPAGRPLPFDGLGVSMRGVGFRYPTGDEVLHDIDVDIPPGARVAVVGETGSGKSTFAKLVTRLLDPTRGEVSIRGIPLPLVPIDDLRRRITFVPQEGFLFDTTVAENVRYGKPGAPDAAVYAAFADLGLTDWIDTLNDGIATRVGERGGQLSAGERQLVALARAWIANPDVLVLDEATSAVDPALDVRIRSAMDRLTAGRTSITVAHRMATAEASDEVLVFSEGRIAERGTHDELLTRDGIYSQLHHDWVAGTSGAP